MPGIFVYKPTKKTLTDLKVWTGSVRRNVLEVYAYSGGVKQLIWFRQPLVLAATPLTWSSVKLDITPPGTGADSYTLTRDGTPVVGYNGTALTFTDTSLAPATGYTYSCTAIRGGIQIATAQVSLVTPSLGDMGLTATNVLWDRATLSWITVTGGSVTAYVLLRGAVQVYSGLSTSFTDIGLDPNTIYSWSIRAMRGTDILVSDSLNVLTPVREAMTVSTSNLLWDRVTLTWTDPAAGGITSYVVNRGGVDVYNSGSASIKTWDDIGALVPSNTYSYYVKAMRGAQVVATSPTVTVTTPARADMGLTATVNAWDKITLAWTDTSGGVDSYELKRSTTVIYTGPLKTFQDTLLMPSTAYSYTLTAKRSGTAMPITDTASATTSAYIDLGLTATAAAYNQINTAWAAENGSVDTFELKRSTTVIYTGNLNAKSDTGLAASTAYSYTLTAKRGATAIKTDTASATTSARPVSTGGVTMGSTSYACWNGSSQPDQIGNIWDNPQSVTVYGYQLRCCAAGYGGTQRVYGRFGNGTGPWYTLPSESYAIATTYYSGWIISGTSGVTTTWPMGTGTNAIGIHRDTNDSEQYRCADTNSRDEVRTNFNYWWYSASTVRTPDGKFVDTKDNPDAQGEHVNVHVESLVLDRSGQAHIEITRVRETGELIRRRGCAGCDGDDCRRWDGEFGRISKSKWIDPAIRDGLQRQANEGKRK